MDLCEFIHSDCEVKSLIVSSRPEILGLENSKCLCTNTDNEDIQWLDLVMKKKVPEKIFQDIYITNDGIFETPESYVDQRVYQAILRILNDSGRLHLCGGFSALEVALETDGYEFTRYSILFNKMFKVFKKRNAIQEKESDIEPETKPERSYEMMEIDLDFLKVEADSIQITLEEFEEELSNPKFIIKFMNSIDELLSYKIDFYLEKQTEVKKKFSSIQKKVRNILTLGMDRTVIRDMYPMYQFYAGFLYELEELRNIIIFIKNNLNPERVKENLLNAIYNIDKGLASLVGREDIKNKIISKLYAFSQNWKVFAGHFCNFALLGGSGVGKTSLGKVISFVFSKSGILATNKVHVVTRSDLIGQYVGQTAPRTRSLLLASLEGVLFIDEAYQLATSCKVDFGHECITEMVNFMDKYIGMSVIIVAGYEKTMKEDFFTSNEGLQRRFSHQIVLKPYSISELTDILVTFLERSLTFELEETTYNYLFTLINSIDKKYPTAFDKQAGDMLNLVEILVTTIFSSYRKKWSNKNNLVILKNSFRKFLSNKGLLE